MTRPLRLIGLALVWLALAAGAASAADGLEKLYLAQNGQLTPEQREAFERLAPSERQRIEQNFQRYQSLPPEQRRQLEQRYERWRELPPDRRERLRERYQELERAPAAPPSRVPAPPQRAR